MQANGAPQTRHVKVDLTPQELVIVLELDLAMHVLAGIEHQFANALARPDAALEVRKVVDHLAGYKARFVAQAQSKLVVAQPDDVPPAA
ncbi:MAG: hypothetical protein ACRD4T_00235 [Candidatus Acidiferrales bacterium]